MHHRPATSNRSIVKSSDAARSTWVRLTKEIKHRSYPNGRYEAGTIGKIVKKANDLGEVIVKIDGKNVVIHVDALEKQ